MTSVTNLNTVTRRDTDHVELVSDIDVAIDMMKDGVSKNHVQEANGETGEFSFNRSVFDDVEGDMDGDHHPVSFPLKIIPIKIKDH